MPRLKITADTIQVRALLIAFILLCFALATVASKWAVGAALATRSEEREVTEVGASLAASDPLSRYANAAAMEKAFDMESIAGSLKEYEAAVALSPHDYRLWLGLGRARERDGDRPGAEAAYRKSLELAPNYSRVHWALGNLLVRTGRPDEGFAHIRDAAASDANFAAPAVAAAWQAFEGDIARVTATLGDGDNTRVELAKRLASQSQFEEAASVWNTVPVEDRRKSFAEEGKAIAQKAFENDRFRLALAISNDFADVAAQIGAVSNGDFEQPIRPKSASLFDWKNVEGLYPQMGPTDGQKRAGEKSLLVRFGDPANPEFRQLSQTIAVEPGGRYLLSLSHRSEIKSQAVFRLEVIAGTNGARLAATEPLMPTKDWLDSSVGVTVPADTDGVTIRLIRENCTPPICTVGGTIWLDEIALRKL